jgi:beta-lactam-binding protein with PASTA domain
VKKGSVISQKPAPGKRLPVGAKVSLVVSKGLRPSRR